MDAVEHSSQECPDFRATIRGGRLVLVVDWGPWLASCGPMYAFLDRCARAGIAIADLTVIRGEGDVAVELIVNFVCGGTERDREALLAWAESVGYRRVWFDAEVHELDHEPAGAAEARCPSCRSRFVDASQPFWQMVRRRGAFPSACPVCGGDVPQWRLAEVTPRGVRVVRDGGEGRAG
jgi:hypothetical protein